MRAPAKTRTSKPARRKPAARAGAVKGHAPAFREIVELIQSARTRAFQAVNTELIGLYWRVGEYISRKLATAAWGEGVVDELARYIARQHPELKGFARPNLFRMRQFYETYQGDTKVSPLLRQLSWSHNILIVTRCKLSEEREFYLRLAAGEKLSFRELERQIDGRRFERTILNPPIVSTVLRQLHPEAETIFKDTYLLDFLELPADHSERDLQRALVKNLKQFLIELGPDFCFAGEELRLQVGGQDFYLDLLFYHRGLQCLVAFELKITKFEPEHLGKLTFYLEALDRDVKKAHERPSIGVLLCASKDKEVVEYVLSRALSPALIAEYQTRLPDRKLLQRKLHEFYQLAMPKVK
ncbi:MAG TPA: PDDEXK nuclease domain-containing protein [Candidatus Paceibacterota bacterium]|nr:PDDEXK nuclease domain-containing protein [Candidatus Paceibacterota bacterium]